MRLFVKIFNGGLFCTRVHAWKKKIASPIGGFGLASTRGMGLVSQTGDLQVAGLLSYFRVAAQLFQGCSRVAAGAAVESQAPLAI